MDTGHLLGREQWEKWIGENLDDFDFFAPIKKWDHIDFEKITQDNFSKIIYNKPRPVSPLKSFFLPIKQNLTRPSEQKPKIIIGVPACDLKGIELLDQIYMDDRYPDTVYRSRRDNAILIGTGCHEILENCHCTSSGINPYPESVQDITLASIADRIVLQPHTEKGEKLIEDILSGLESKQADTNILEEIKKIRAGVTNELKEINDTLPGYDETGELITESDREIWAKYAGDCVSCGACATSCPTCSCFLLIDRPGFEKVRSIDACQFPGFERVAAGEDPLGKLADRFRNRYLCKYVWKPERFQAIACTGCGRCIDACIGKINKNELIRELNDKITVSNGK